MSKKKSVYAGRKSQNEMNKKAIIWTISCLVAIVILMTVLLIFNK